MDKQAYESMVQGIMKQGYESYMADLETLEIENPSHADAFFTGFQMGMSAIISMIRDRGITQSDINAKLATDAVINKMKGGN
jgi:hypothetical protein